MADEPMTDEQIKAALMRGVGEESPPNNPLRDSISLRQSLADYTAPKDFEPGTIVRPKLGLCVNERKYRVIALIFVKYLKEPQEIYFPRYFNADCVVGSADVEGDMSMSLADSNRLEVYPQDEIEALGKEAAKAIN